MRDLRVEKWLEQRSAPYTFVPGFQLVNIDRQRSRANQARLREPITQDLAETYGLQMLDGVDFTAIIVYMHAPDRYTIISGNHRDEGAAQAKIKTLDAYVVHVSDPAIIDVLTRTANEIEGVRACREDAVEQALHLKARHGYTLKDAAAMFGLPERVLRSAHQVQVAETRLEKLQINAKQYTPTTRARLGNIQDDHALRGAATLVKEANISGLLLEELVTSLNRERTSEAKAEILQQWDARPDIQAAKIRGEGGRRRPQPTRDDHLLSLFQRIFGHMARTAPGMHADEHRRAVLVDSWKKLSAMIEEYLGVEKDGERANGATTTPAPTTV